MITTSCPWCAWHSRSITGATRARTSAMLSPPGGRSSAACGQNGWAGARSRSTSASWVMPCHSPRFCSASAVSTSSGCAGWPATKIASAVARVRESGVTTQRAGAGSRWASQRCSVASSRRVAAQSATSMSP